MKIKKFLLYILLAILSISLCGCAAGGAYSDADSLSPGGSSGFTPEYVKPGVSSDASDSYDPSSPDYDVTDSPGDESYGDKSDDIIIDENKQGPLAGQITSSEWSDIKKYDYWLSLFESSQENSEGLFSNYFTTLSKYNSKLYTQKMIKVNVSNEEAISGLKVRLFNETYSFNAVTDVFGNAYLFLPENPSFPYVIAYGDQLYELTEYPQDTINLELSDYQNDNNKKILDLMFVIDTTGSMGDELEYLKSEIKDVIESINTDNNTIRLSLLFYRDKGDQYVTRLFDFTNDINEQIQNINKQSANGGGDFEEAVDEALNIAVTQANWSSSPSTKLLIHVLDAPPHSTAEKINLFASSIISAANKGIRIIPVASSGINKWTEFLLRTEALMTGGTYTYITNDSGIGNGHIDATTEEKAVVEYLNAMLVRIINEYHTGVVTEPIPYYQTQK
ncbi:MAG: VWA domain-containing protein [Bacilli bacterium]|nr:VWA domain-containing protein [Bacilli bacterium]